MQEKLFNFLTIRPVRKGASNTSSEAIDVKGHISNYVVQKHKSLAERRQYLEDQWKIYKGRSLHSLSPKLRLLSEELRALSFQLTPANFSAIVQRIFGRDVGYILANSTYKYQFGVVRNAFAIAVMRSPGGPAREIKDAMRTIHLLESLHNKKLKTATDVAQVLELRFRIHEDVPAFLAQEKAANRSPRKDPEATTDPSKKEKELRERLHKVGKALQETKARHAHEVKPELVTRDKSDKTRLLHTDVHIRFSTQKLESFSPDTRKIIEQEGHDTNALSVDGVRNSLKNLQQSIISELADNSVATSVRKVLVNGKLMNLNDLVAPYAPELKLPDFSDPNPYVKPLGLGELKTVEQVNVKYEIGEIAHIENVLQGELKVREHRQENFQEQIDEIEEQRSESTENQLETTQRHELSTESRRVLNEASKLDLSVHTDSDFGPYLEVQTDTNYSTSKAKEQSNAAAANFARETVEKAAQRVQESVRERRQTTKSRKINELNRHELNNADGDGHVVGIYRWLNKKYDAQVRTHGFRAMYEFTVPEPAAFHLLAETNSMNSQFVLDEPLPPTNALFGADTPLRPEHLFEGNYLILGAQYEVASLAPPPAEEVVLMQTVGENVSSEGNDYRTLVKNLNFDIPKGYLPELVIGAGNLVPGAARTMGVVASIGRHVIHGQGLHFDASEKTHQNNFTLLGSPQLQEMGGGQGSVEARKFPVSIVFYDAAAVSMTLIVRCTRTSEAYRQWQIETFEGIMQGYREMKAEYEEKLRGFQYSQGIVIGGNNPLENIKIQETELKKHCVAFLTRSHLDGYKHLYEQEIETSGGQKVAYPEIDFDRMQANATQIQFIENAFEWNKMMYQFYPYFWSGKENWITKRSHASNDPQFQEFLRAGAARVMLAVREGYEEAVAYYLQTGFVPQETSQITFGDNLFVDMVDLMKEEQAQSLGEVIDEWKVTLPTNLVILDDPTAVARVAQVTMKEEEQ